MLRLARAWDPLYGRIEFSDYEFKLVRLPEVQRLRYIRMCNINSLLVTGASEISRFEHTLGVLRLAQEWLSTHPWVSGNDANDLIAAAILHDMQTGPFGHSFQYVLEDNQIEGNFSHDDIKHGQKASLAYYQDLVAKASFGGKPFGASALLADRWTTVSSLIKGKNRLGPLISGTMDLDNIDNVIRLAYHVGVAQSKDAEIALKLARVIEVCESGLTIPLHAVEQIIRWQEIRSELYRLLLLDWAEFSAKAMLTRAMERAISLNLVGSDTWVETDAGLLEHLEKRTVGDAQDIGELVKRLRRGDLYEPVALLRSPSTEHYEYLSRVETKSAVEAELTSHAKKKLNMAAKLILHLILDKGKTEREVTVTAKETGEVIIVGQNSNRLLVGIFISKFGVSENESNELTTKTIELLQNIGLRDLVPLEDPMGPIGDKDKCHPQLQLL